MSMPTFVTASFISGILMAMGINHHQQTQAQIQKQRQAQIAMIQAQNKALCKQLKAHNIKPPRGVTC